jgi:hypothetical protein
MNILEKLAQQFGDRVKVRSAYHVQILSEKMDKPNDIWFTQHGQLKFKLYGNRQVIEDINLDFIVKRIKGSATKKSDLDLMHEMLNVSKFIEHCEKTFTETGPAVFTDAGFKNGKARMAAVKMEADGTVTAKSYIAAVANIQDAEEAAIILGQSLDSFATIYNDNQQAVARFNTDRIKWLPRNKTSIADHFGNIRK